MGNQYDFSKKKEQIVTDNREVSFQGSDLDVVEIPTEAVAATGFLLKR